MNIQTFPNFSQSLLSASSPGEFTYDNTQIQLCIDTNIRKTAETQIRDAKAADPVSAIFQSSECKPPLGGSQLQHTSVDSYLHFL